MDKPVSLKCATCPISCGCSWSCLRGDDLAEIYELRRALQAAGGYLTNAAIDLRTGAPKRTALNTIEGGLKIVAAALTGHETGGRNG